MNLLELKKQAIELIKFKPEFKEQIQELYYLAVSEIQDGGSETHECQLAYNDMIEITE